MAAGPANESVTASEIESFVDTTLGLTGFTAARIRGETLGEPLLHVSIARDPAGTPIAVHARQVQDEQLTTLLSGEPFAELPHVPWSLGCATVENDDVGELPPFSACDVAGVTPATATRVHPGGGVTDDIALVRNVGITSDTAWFATFGGGLQLPGGVGVYGVLSGVEVGVAFPEFVVASPFDYASPTWLLACAPGDASAVCLGPDADGDGVVALGDCNELDPDTSPEAPDPLGVETWLDGSPDRDCDGWPTAFTIDPFARGL